MYRLSCWVHTLVGRCASVIHKQWLLPVIIVGLQNIPTIGTLQVPYIYRKFSISCYHTSLKPPKHFLCKECGTYKTNYLLIVMYKLVYHNVHKGEMKNLLIWFKSCKIKSLSIIFLLVTSIDRKVIGQLLYAWEVQVPFLNSLVACSTYKAYLGGISYQYTFGVISQWSSTIKMLSYPLIQAGTILIWHEMCWKDHIQ